MNKKNDDPIQNGEPNKLNQQSTLKQQNKKELLRFLVAGNVDDGKSTLIGRLLYDAHLIHQDQLAAMYHDSKTFNTTSDEIDLSLLTDGLKAEREQGITIDVAYRYFSTEQRTYIICDAPGHEQYTRNMATGASQCDLALILVDAQNGIRDQTRRHSLIATLMGIRKIVVVINKMDLMNFDETVFNNIRQEYLKFSGKFNIDTLHFIPVSALKSDNVVKQTGNMPWYSGGSLLNYLENIPLSNHHNLTDFRLPVQYVIRTGEGFRGYAGNIASGIVRSGDEIIVFPSRKRTCVKSIETFDEPLHETFAPLPAVITTVDELDISRGTIIAKPNNVPRVATVIEAMIVWMDDDKPLIPRAEYLLKCNTQSIPAHIKTIRYKYNMNKLSRINADELNINDVGRVQIELHRELIFDPFEQNRTMGSFIVIDRNSNKTSGGGIILSQITDEDKAPKSANLHKENSDVTAQARHAMLGYKPLTLWLTGLSGSGKSSIAKIIEKKLMDLRINTCILDGDNLRSGLCADLGFSAEDRSENIRRVSELARLMNDAGVVAIAALISPFKRDRDRAASLIGNNYIEVFIDASIETCIDRDPKGLYAKAINGEITGFTGIDAPYEKPANPQLHIRTEDMSAADAAVKIIEYILPNLLFSPAFTPSKADIR